LEAKTKRLFLFLLFTHFLFTGKMGTIIWTTTSFVCSTI